MADFDATKGGTAATSYATVEEADDYFELDYNADEWENLTETQKQKLLATATMQIDRFTPLFDKVGEDQALNFPVTPKPENEGYCDNLGDGFAQVKEACILQALFVYQSSDAINEAREAAIQGAKSETIGPVSKSMTGFNPLTKWAPGVLSLLNNYVDLEMRIFRA